MSVTRRLVSQTTQASAPFCFAQPFAQGECATSVVCAGATSYQVTVLRRWPDGSVKHASISGFAAITASTNSPAYNNNPTTLTLSSGTPPTGSNLTAASIATAAPTASVQCGALGTVTLGSLLATPFSTFQSGPQMVECLYRGDVGGGTELVVWYYVRMWLGGLIEIEASVENSFLDNGAGSIATRAVQNYIPTVIIDGNTIFTNGGASFEHYPNNAWSSIGWVGTDPQVFALHDPAYLMASKVVPNYDRMPPDSSALDALSLTYTPYSIGGWRTDMGGGGSHPQIGILPIWDALCCTSGDVRGLKAAETGSRALRSFRITFRDKTTNLPPKPSAFPTWSHNGSGAGGTDQLSTTTLTWEQNHAGSGGYVAYLLTGRPIHLDTMALQSSVCWLVLSVNAGSGTSRILFPGQIRGIAWSSRTVGQYVAIAPTGDAVAAEYRTVMENSYDYWHGLGPGSSTSQPLGYPINIGSYDVGYPLTVAPWQYHFWMGVNGHLYDADMALTSPTNQLAFTKWMYKGVVGILGPTGSSYFYFGKAGAAYTVRVSDLPLNGYGHDPSDDFYPNWGLVYANTYGVSNSENTNALEVGGGLDPTAYWANLKPAAAMAAEHGVPGGAAAWARLIGATNSSTFLNSGFQNNPIFGIGPRTIVVIDPDGVPTSAGRSTRVETPALMATRTQVGVAGMGVLGSEAANAGLNGQGALYQVLEAGDSTYEVSLYVTRSPSPLNGTLYTYEDGSFTYTDISGATEYFEFLTSVAGVPLTVDVGYGPGITRVQLESAGSVGFRSFWGLSSNHYTQG